MSYEGTAEFMYALHDAALLLFYNVQMRETKREGGGGRHDTSREEPSWEKTAVSNTQLEHHVLFSLFLATKCGQ